MRGWYQNGHTGRQTDQKEHCLDHDHNYGIPEPTYRRYNVLHAMLHAGDTGGRRFR